MCTFAGCPGSLLSVIDGTGLLLVLVLPLGTGLLAGLSAGAEVAVLGEEEEEPRKLPMPNPLRNLSI